MGSEAAQKIQHFYKLLGSIIKSSISEEWNEATLHVKRAEGVVGFTGEYFTEKGEEKDLSTDELDYNTMPAIEDLYLITTEGGSNDWNRLEM